MTAIKCRSSASRSHSSMGNKTSSHPDYTEEWTHNSEAKICEKCERRFTVTLRRHHCRHCGGCFCHGCSSQRTVLQKNSLPKRVCDKCYGNVNLKTAISAGYGGGGDTKAQLDSLLRGSISLYRSECYQEGGKPWLFTESKQKFILAKEGFESLIGMEHPLFVVIANIGAAMEKGDDITFLEKEYELALHNSTTEQNHIKSPADNKEIQHFLTLFETLPDLKNAGKIDEAMEVGERVVKGFECLCGHEDVRTITAVNTLAGICMAAGDLDKSEELFRRALLGREKIFGHDHQQSLNSANNLATVLFERGQLEPAIGLYLRAFDGYGNLLGKDHPSTVSAKENLELARLSLHTINTNINTNTKNNT